MKKHAKKVSLKLFLIRLLKVVSVSSTKKQFLWNKNITVMQNFQLLNILIQKLRA